MQLGHTLKLPCLCSHPGSLRAKEEGNRIHTVKRKQNPGRWKGKTLSHCRGSQASLFLCLIWPVALFYRLIPCHILWHVNLCLLSSEDIIGEKELVPLCKITNYSRNSLNVLHLTQLSSSWMQEWFDGMHSHTVCRATNVPMITTSMSQPANPSLLRH